MDGHPAGLERRAVGVQLGDERVRRVGLQLVGGDGGAVLALDLQRLQGAALGEVGLVGGDEAVDVAVGGLAARHRGAADVLDQPDVAVLVVLHALVAAGTERVEPDGLAVDRVAVVVEGDAEHPAVGRLGLGSEQQLVGERVPGDAVDRRVGVARVVDVGDQRDPLGRVGLVEVDAGDVAARPALVALVEEVPAAEGEVDVLVRLGLAGLVGGLRERAAGLGVVAVVGDAVGGVGVDQRERAPRDRGLGGGGGQHVVLDARSWVGVRDVGHRGAVVAGATVAGAAVRDGRRDGQAGEAAGEERTGEAGAGDALRCHDEPFGRSRGWPIRDPRPGHPEPRPGP